MPSEEDKQTRMLTSIKEGIEQIEGIVRECTTRSVVHRCFLEQGDPRPDLHSPAKQIAFLLGLMLATDEPVQGREFNDSDWRKVKESLHNIFYAYISRYSPDDKQFREEPADWHRKREIAVLAFTDYFQKTMLATPEDIAELIRLYIVPYDDQLSQDFGITASDALTVAEGIIHGIQERFEANYLATPEERLACLTIRLEDIVSSYGMAGTNFWNLFAIGRGEGESLQYPTDKSVVEYKPCIRLSGGTAFSGTMQDMLLAILSRSESCLSSGDRKENYFRHRAQVLEDQAASMFVRLLGPGTQVYRNLFETSTHQQEHDLVIVHKDICLFVEAKSAPPDEPFRDPERAFTRLRRSFRSDTGIQKAYNQALRMMNALKTKETCVLYDHQGQEALSLSSAILDKAFCVCVTRDNHGPVATCLSFLLEKEETDPYPWVISTLDLQNIIEVWQYYKWGAKQLKAFLKYRIQLHTSLFGDDELDYVGAYVRNCGLHHFVAPQELPLPINPSYSNLFDWIHNHLFRDAPLFRTYPVYPEPDDVQKFLQTGISIFSNSLGHRRIKAGRNEACPCDSGVKFKRCHGML